MKFTKRNAKKYGKRGGEASGKSKRRQKAVDLLNSCKRFRTVDGKIVGETKDGKKITLETL